MSRRRYCFDIDGVLCTEERTFDREFAEPNIDTIATIRVLYNRGNIIILWTARGWEQWETTQNWLQKYQVPYHTLLMGKPQYDIMVDDKAVSNIHIFRNRIGL